MASYKSGPQEPAFKIWSKIGLITLVYGVRSWKVRSYILTKLKACQMILDSLGTGFFFRAACQDCQDVSLQ